MIQNDPSATAEQCISFLVKSIGEGRKKSQMGA